MCVFLIIISSSSIVNDPVCVVVAGEADCVCVCVCL